MLWVVRDTLNAEIIEQDEAVWPNPEQWQHEPETIAAVWQQTVFTQKYDAIEVLHYNPWLTFVPAALYDADFKTHYLQWNTQLFETDYIATDTLAALEMVSVYIPWVSLNNLLIDRLGKFEYQHALASWLTQFIPKSRWDFDKKMTAHRLDEQLDLVVTQNGKLILYNSFLVQSPEDILYYILFTAEQLQLNPELFSLQLLGEWPSQEGSFDLLYKYIRHVELAESTQISPFALLFEP
jgi:hypothetical protein